jgi:hypothetical protein
VNALSIAGSASPAETDEQRKERMRHQAIIEALEDERVNDEASFKAAILARRRRAEADQATGSNGSNGSSSKASAAPKRWAVDDGREYPILTERAEAVARWIREAPTASGTGSSKRKKKPVIKKMPSASTSEKTGSTDSSLEATFT